ncbi:MAG: hypothetical protein LUG18_16170 [Candidatus Azobacteroides sp.]|nr:hypothetical protein [Candidatus Azobacteroides sp.]
MNILEIEVLLSKYWNCETSVEEELILKNFFVSEEVPEYLEKYKAFFLFQEKQQHLSVHADFDKKVMDIISRQEEEKTISIYNKKQLIFHLVRVAAVILLCLIVGLGTAYLVNEEEEIIHYTDTYTDPEDAFKVIQHAVFAVSDNLQDVQFEVMDALEKTEMLNEYIQPEIKTENQLN